MAEAYDGTRGLKTLEGNGQPPHTRMDNAQMASERIQILLNAEKQGRAQRRALVKGIVDGNPPYRNQDQRRAGRANACNVNWRIAEFYLNSARSAFYDIFSEAPTMSVVRTNFGDTSSREKWGRIITEEYDYLLRADPCEDYHMQISQYEMILYGCGPMMFLDDTDWRSESVLCRNLIVPDFAPSDQNQWEECCILKDYRPSELFNYIRNPVIASAKGWHIETTQRSIMEAHTKRSEGGRYDNWEWHQQELKNRSYHYDSQCRVVSVAHYYFKEFAQPGELEGRISHCMLINPEDTQNQSEKYLFSHVGRFANWNQVIHPMYYDNDGGGYHHSVTGLGIKMYSAMEYQNRLLCNLADKAFAPKILFKPLTQNSNEQLNLIQFAEYGKVPSQFDVLQIPIGSHIEDGVLFNREVAGMLASNLAQYRSNLGKETGNPITAYEAGIRASEQSRLSKTQLNHYYKQMDGLFAEKYRRAVNPKLTGFMPGGRLARQFQDACLRRGVPMEALRNVESVKATRIVGQGSQFMRQQAIQQLLAIMTMLNEEGRNNLLNDFIASLAGQAMVDRYNPPVEISPEIADQRAIATLQVAAAKDSVPPVVTPSQNHYIFAETFLIAASQATASLQQGADPANVFAFLETIGPAIAQHIQLMSADPTRAEAAKRMSQQLAQLAKLQNELGKQIEDQQQDRMEQAQAAQEAQMIESGQDPKWRIKAAETDAKLAISQRKTEAMLGMKRQRHEQDMALSDASTAAEILRKNRQTGEE